MAELDRKKRYPVWREWPFIIGLLITLLVVSGFGYSLRYLPVTTDEAFYISKWIYLREAHPNEIGDALAGVAGSLAFVWLVVTVWLQATELREQRDEFEKMAEAQGRQVELLVAQGEIYLDEQRQRKEAEARELAEEVVATLRHRLYMHPITWEGPENSLGGRQKVSLNMMAAHDTKSRFSDDEFFHYLVGHLEKSLERVHHISKIPANQSNPTTEELRPIREATADFLMIFEKLSEAQKVRFERLRIADLDQQLARYAKADIWAKPVNEVRPK